MLSIKRYFRSLERDGSRKSFFLYSLVCLFLLSSLASCRKEQVLLKSTASKPEGLNPTPNSKIRGFYLLCEGSMGQNKASLDYLDLHKGTFERSIYAERNPNAIKELGDVGNDIKIYGSKMYVVVNASHKLEVLDARTAKRLKKIDIANCRYIAFNKGKAYVSSYVGEIKLDPKAPRGEVLQIDTASLEIERRTSVGYQPEEMAVVGDYLYVANSGGYRAPNYDDRLSVISLANLELVDNIVLGINLHRVLKDNKQQLWVSSRGNYNGVASCLFRLKYNAVTGREELVERLEVPCSAMALRDDKLLVLSTEYNAIKEHNTITYRQINTATGKVLKQNFITDGTETSFQTPYGIAVNPETKELYITDAKNNTSSGSLHCYSPEGKRLWTARTGDIPAHFAFLK